VDAVRALRTSYHHFLEALSNGTQDVIFPTHPQGAHMKALYGIVNLDLVKVRFRPLSFKLSERFAPARVHRADFKVTLKHLFLCGRSCDLGAGSVFRAPPAIDPDTPVEASDLRY
jgi:hypothetical protein